METGRMFNIGKLLQYGFSKIVGVKPDDKSNISTKFNVSDPKAELVEGAENKINGQEISLEIFGLFKTLLEFSQGKSEDIWKFTSNFTPSISGVEDSDNMIEIIKAIMTGEQDSLTFKIQKLINIFMKHLKLDKEFNIGDFEGKGKTQFDADIEQEISKIEDEEGDEETEGVTSLVKEKVVLNKDDFSDYCTLFRLCTEVFFLRDNYTDVSGKIDKLAIIMGKISNKMGFRSKATTKDAVLLGIGLCSNDISLISRIAINLSTFETDRIKEFFNILTKFKCRVVGESRYGLPELPQGIDSQYILAKKELTLPNFVDKGDSSKDKEGEEGEKNDDYGDNTSLKNLYKSLFMMFDRDSTGDLNFGEFQDLCKYMGLALDAEQNLRIFSVADIYGENSVRIEEFPKVIKLIKNQIINETLTGLKLTPRDLIMFGVITLIYLMLTLTFILLGVYVFSKAEGFNSVINSIFPLIAGVGAASRSLGISDRVGQVKEYIETFIKNLRKG